MKDDDYESILHINLPCSQLFTNFRPQINQYDHALSGPVDLPACHQSVENGRLNFF